MKKMILALILAAALFFAACAPVQQAGFDGEALQAASKEYTQNMIDGDFEAVAKHVAPSMSAQLSADVLKKGWDETVAPLGEFEKITRVDFSSNGNAAFAVAVCNYAHKAITVQYTYNPQGEITGLWITYAPKVVEAENTDAYTEADVRIGTNQPLSGILTLPRDVENPPVVVMVHGSGAQDMNETVGTAGNKPFAEIAHGLAERGIASLRYNKRTAQYPNEPADPKNLTIQYEVLDDAAAAVALLKETQGVDASRIYVLGHSFGGMLAPKIAQDGDLAGLISLAGSPRSLLDIMLDQNEAAVAAGMGTEQDLEQAKTMIDQARNAKQGDLSVMLGATGNYWYTLNQIDTPAIALSLDMPMLFLQGEADFQVSPEQDFGAWQALFAGKQNATFLSYPGLSHFFTPAGPTNTAADYDAPFAVDTQVVADIAEWIDAHS